MLLNSIIALGLMFSPSLAGCWDDPDEICDGNEIPGGVNATRQQTPLDDLIDIDINRLKEGCGANAPEPAFISIPITLHNGLAGSYTCQPAWCCNKTTGSDKSCMVDFKLSNWFWSTLQEMNDDRGKTPADLEGQAQVEDIVTHCRTKPRLVDSQKLNGKPEMWSCTDEHGQEATWPPNGPPNASSRSSSARFGLLLAATLGATLFPSVAFGASPTSTAIDMAGARFQDDPAQNCATEILPASYTDENGQHFVGGQCCEDQDGSPVCWGFEPAERRTKEQSIHVAHAGARFQEDPAESCVNEPLPASYTDENGQDFVGGQCCEDKDGAPVCWGFEPAGRTESASTTLEFRPQITDAATSGLRWNQPAATSLIPAQRIRLDVASPVVTPFEGCYQAIVGDVRCIEKTLDADFTNRPEIKDPNKQTPQYPTTASETGTPDPNANPQSAAMRTASALTEMLLVVGAAIGISFAFAL